MKSAATESSIVGAKFSASSRPMSPPVRIERPRSPCARRPRNSTYWTGSGRLSPSASRICSICAALAFSPASATAGSPGMSRSARNTTVTTPSSTGSTYAMRRRT